MSSEEVASSMVFVDLETTGGMASVDRITEIGIVELDGHGRLSEWSSLVNPQVSIPSFIQNLTGITDGMVAGAPTFSDLADEVLSRLKGRLFVAHNARFDYGFLRQEFSRLGVDFRARVLCTVKLSRHVEPRFERHGLDALIERHGLVVPARHRALGDAQVLVQYWRVLQARLPEEALREAVDELTGLSVWPAQMSPALLEELPETHGVYVLWDMQGQALHVGGGPNVKQRLLAHFSADRKAPPARKHAHLVDRVQAHRTTGELGTALLEARLRHELGPLHNRGAQASRHAWTWRLAGAEASDQGMLVLHPADGLSGLADEPVYGLFGTQRDAVKTLREIAQNAQLCLRALGLEQGQPGQPCKGLRQEQCAGVCVGRESAPAHTERMRRVLADWCVPAWPHLGPVKVEEGSGWHVLHAWRYLGTAYSEDEVRELLARPLPEFDRHTYKMLAAGLPGWQAVAIA